MIIDDSSTSIVYSGQWMTDGNDQEYNNTIHGSWTEGSKATISFTGLSIQVYGTIERDHSNGDTAFAPRTKFMIDGQNDSATTFMGTPGANILYKQLLYQSPKLSSDRHELVVTLTTSSMNTMWIDYFKIEEPGLSAGAVAREVAEKPGKVSPGLIAGAVVGGVIIIVLLVIIYILWRRVSHLKRRRAQYEKVPRKATEAYWPWMTRSPGELTPFGSDPFSNTQPLNGVLRPFSVHYTPYSSESSDFPQISAETSISGYTVRGDTAADKTTARESISTGYTSLSGFTTRGGTSSEKTVSSLIPTASPSSSSQPGITRATRPSPPNMVQSTTRAEQTERHTRPPRRKEVQPPKSASPDSRPRLSPAATPTIRVVGEGEEVPPAYSTNPRYSSVK